tara:strand:+ start:2264 stop:2755 length:492 start_codon:yes stop_codon:yes gene_type:complete
MGKGKDKKEKKEKKGKDKKEKKGKKTNSNQNTEFEQTKYSGGIALTKLKHVIMKKKGKKGKVKGLFIPIKENHLVEGKEGAVYVNISVIAKHPQDEYGQNGFIAQNGNKKWSEASEEEQDTFRDLPILGNIKCFEDTGAAQNDTSGDIGGGKEFDEDDDDLPF